MTWINYENNPLEEMGKMGLDPVHNPIHHKKLQVMNPMGHFDPWAKTYLQN